MIDLRERPCIHWNGLQNERCTAGVNYRELADGSKPGVAFRLPCWMPALGRQGHEAVACARLQRKTKDDEAREEADMAAAVNRFAIALPTLTAWRKKQPIGKAEVIECPVCKNRLHLSQSERNGHIAAVCETAGCLKFME